MAIPHKETVAPHDHDRCNYRMDETGAICGGHPVVVVFRLTYPQLRGRVSGWFKRCAEHACGQRS